MRSAAITAKTFINEFAESFNFSPRLFNLVPLIPKQQNDKQITLLKELSNSSEAATVLKEIGNESVETLIKIREKSMELPIKNLNSMAFELLAESFSMKNLRFDQVSWDNSSVRIVEFVALNDRVRPVQDWTELMRRLNGDFRCYGVFHEMLKTPVSFVYVRLYKGLASTLHNLMNDTLEASEHDSCVFYSISSPVKGLNGIEFGGKLIKNVMTTIRSERPQIKIFSTFSPIPNFRLWLQKNHEKFRDLTDLKTIEQVKEWESELMSACAEYLEKNRTEDPVAKFHYRNGAKLGPIRFNADPSQDTFKKSYGIQVNYIYSQ